MFLSPLNQKTMKFNIHLMSCMSLLFCLLAMNNIIAQSADDIPNGPITEITFTETEFDFGTVNEGEKISHVFTFKNTGDVPLILSSAKGSCGCTVPRWPKEPILPGETASIEVSFNSKNKKGKRNQKVTLTANTNPAQSFLYLKGEVLYDVNESEFTIEDQDLENENESIDVAELDCVAIYPNPTSDVLKLDLGNNIGKEAVVRIFSKTGQLMAEKIALSIDGTIEFEVHHYPADTYVANVQIRGQKPTAYCFVVTGQ